MNIFVLDTNPIVAAKYHCDKHVVKMILETAQMLSVVAAAGYKPTHANHPCTLWAGECWDNVAWLVQLARALNVEYKTRYGKSEDHISMSVIDTQIVPALIRKYFDGKLPVTYSTTPFRQCMPDEYKDADPVVAYRNYYKGDKVRFAKWRNGEPDWWNE